MGRATTPRKQALALIEQYGAELLIDQSGPHELWGSVWSPAGSVFVATGCHVIALGFRTNRPAGWKALCDDLRYGIEACAAVDCDTCTPSND